MLNLRYSELDFKLLPDENKKMIQEKVECIRTNHNLSNVEFNLIDFLVNVEHFEIKSQYIDDETTGLLIIDDNKFVQNSNSNRVIIINRNIDEDKEFIQKRRFISAHEYAHFILHKKNSTQFARRDEKTISIPENLAKRDEKTISIPENHTDNLDKSLLEELEAEYFAYCFLLPEHSLKTLFYDKDIKKIVERLKNNGLTIIEIVANLFNVSISKAKKRLDMLGLS